MCVPHSGVLPEKHKIFQMMSFSLSLSVSLSFYLPSVCLLAEANSACVLWYRPVVVLSVIKSAVPVSNSKFLQFLGLVCKIIS